MSDFFGSLSKVVHTSIILAVLLFLFLSFGAGGFALDQLFWSWLFRYIHVVAGVMWIGLLYYFNFVQVPNMSKITDDQKPAITIVTGLIVAYLNGYLHEAMTLGVGSGGGKYTAIGIGMWLGLIMAFNVWFIIWPNQKKVLGIVEATPEEKPVAAKKALIASRTNTLLSLPMLLTMVAAQNLY